MTAPVTTTPRPEFESSLPESASSPAPGSSAHVPAESPGSEASDTSPALPTPQAHGDESEVEDGVVHVTETADHLQKRGKKEWFENRAYPTIPSSLPATFRQFWASTYRTIRNSKPETRRRQIRDKVYVYHEPPTIVEVMQHLSNALLTYISGRLEELEGRVSEYEEHARRITWSQLLAVARCNILEFLMTEDPEARMKATFKVYDYVVKLAGGKEKTEIFDALLETKAEKVDALALVRDYQEKLARMQRNIKEEVVN